MCRSKQFDVQNVMGIKEKTTTQSDKLLKAWYKLGSKIKLKCFIYENALFIKGGLSEEI